MKRNGIADVKNRITEMLLKLPFDIKMGLAKAKIPRIKVIL